MTLVPWDKFRNLENSFADYLQAQIDADSLTVLDADGSQIPVTVRVGQEFNDSWKLPVITLYVDSKNADRLVLGSNLRLDAYTVIIDVRALDKGSKMDITNWIETKINDGFPYYIYTPNLSDPNNPTKVLGRLVDVDFISNVSINFGTASDLFDKYRQNLTVSCNI